MLEKAVAEGVVQRVRPGIYALAGADPLLMRCAETNSMLTCASAARAHGLWLLAEPEALHLLRPDGKLKAADAVVHRGTWKEPEGAFIASLMDTLMHALACLPELEALVMVESAALQQRVTVAELRGLLRGPGSRRALAILDLVDRGADSLIETVARVHLRRAGFRVDPQVTVAGVGSMDHIVEDCVDVELDGKEHRRPESRQKDYERDLAAQAQGYAVVRFGYADVVHRPEWMVERVRAVVARRLALGGLPDRRQRVDHYIRPAEGSGR
ncbi:hypothetical protein GCM10028789_14810 [Sinomonas halotolerans]